MPSSKIVLVILSVFLLFFSLAVFLNIEYHRGCNNYYNPTYVPAFFPKYLHLTKEVDIMPVDTVKGTFNGSLGCVGGYSVRFIPIDALILSFVFVALAFRKKKK